MAETASPHEVAVKAPLNKLLEKILEQAMATDDQAWAANKRFEVSNFQSLNSNSRELELEFF